MVILDKIKSLLGWGRPKKTGPEKPLLVDTLQDQLEKNKKGFEAFNKRQEALAPKQTPQGDPRH
jgi:hypothetical protein